MGVFFDPEHQGYFKKLIDALCVCLSFAGRLRTLLQKLPIVSKQLYESPEGYLYNYVIRRSLGICPSGIKLAFLRTGHYAQVVQLAPQACTDY